MQKINDWNIGNKIILALVIVALVPMLIIGWYASRVTSNALEANSLKRMEFHVQAVAEKINTSLNGIAEDVKFLSQVPPVQGIIRARAGKGRDAEGKSNYAQWVQRLQTIFTHFGQTKTHYMQLRYLDERGKEMVRVDFDKGLPQRVAEHALQNKSAAGYFKTTMQLSAGEVYVSPLNLNREQGKIETPHRPVIRFAVPIFDTGGKRRGIVIANVLGQRILAALEHNHNMAEGEFYLVNRDGYFLYHPDPGKTWGFELDRPFTISQEIPELSAVSTDKLSDVLPNLNGQTVAYAHIYPDPANREQYWRVIYSLPRAQILASVSQFQLIFSGLMAIALTMAIGIGLWLSRKWFTGPLTTLLAVLQRFSGGEVTARVASVSGDEIGQLAAAFNDMAQQHQETQARIHQQLTQLQQAADISERVETLRAHIAKVADGDLTQTIADNGNDDLAQLAQHLNSMTGGLTSISKQILETSNAITSTLSQVSSATKSQAAAAAEQASAVNQTSATLEEIKQTSALSLEKAQALGVSANRANQESELGLQAIEDTIEGMDGIRERMSDIAQTILALSEQTQQIGEITDAVSTLSQQSKMLALNASIEAAKAGEAGKGFAVVAAEVKELAEQSQQSTVQVQQLLQEIRHATDRAVMATEEGSKGVDAGVAQVQKTGGVVRQLGDVIHETAMASQQIVAAVRQEATGIDQVHQAMAEINRATGQFVSSSRQTDEAGKDLAGLAEKLRQNISVYKLRADAPETESIAGIER